MCWSSGLREDSSDLHLRPNSNGQLDNSFGNQQEGFPLSPDSRDLRATVPSGGEQRDSSLSSSHSGSPECSGGRSFEGFSCADGMDYSSERVQTLRRLAQIPSSDRSLCESLEPQDSDVRDHPQSSEGYSGECIHGRLESLGPSLPFSTGESSSQGGSEAPP